jgi:PAS domain S-box-containing protein
MNQLQEEIMLRTIMQDELAVREEYIQAIFENITDGVIVINGLGVIESLNPAAEIIFGYESGLLEGMSISVLLPEDSRAEHDAYLADADNNMARIMSTNRELYGRKHDGSLFSLELGIARMQVGGETRFVGIIRDVSVRKQMEISLRRSEEALATAQQIAHVGSWDWSVVNNTLECSDEVYRILDLTYFEGVVSYDDLMAYFHRDDRARVRALIEKGINEKDDGFNLDARIVCSSGGQRDVRVQGRIYRDSAGVTQRVIGTLHDITDISVAEKMKNEFVSIVSHELRTPLHGIISFSRLGIKKAETLTKEKMLTYFEEVLASGKHLLALVNDLLDVEKLELGKMDLDCEYIDVKVLLAEVVSRNSAYSNSQGITLVAECDSGDYRVYVDRVRLIQALTNLLANAIKFSNAGDNIELKVTVGEGVIRISVIDYGVGIPYDFQPRIFQKFSQYDSSSSRKAGGTGLGLCITRAIIERHGGSVHFASTPGLGTSFHCELPRAG